MTIESGNTSDTWTKLFPNPQRRHLARAFVEKVSQLPGVERVATIELGSGETGQRIFVFTKDDYGVPMAEDLLAVSDAYQEICTTPESQELLGYTPVITDSLFEYDWMEVPGLKDRNVETIWERNTTPPDSNS